MAFSREFGETESPPRWDMKMERCLGRWLKGPLFLYQIKSVFIRKINRNGNKTSPVSKINGSVLKQDLFFF